MNDPDLLTIPGLSFGGKPYATQEVATAWLGPPFVGLIVHLVLSGVFFALLANYLASANYRAESRTNRVLVWVVGLLVLSLTVLVSIQGLYHGLNQDRSPASVFMTAISDCPISLFNGAAGSCVQSFLAIRASRLFRRRQWVRRIFLVVIMFAIW